MIQMRYRSLLSALFLMLLPLMMVGCSKERTFADTPREVEEGYPITFSLRSVLRSTGTADDQTLAAEANEKKIHRLHVAVFDKSEKLVRVISSKGSLKLEDDNTSGSFLLSSPGSYKLIFIANGVSELTSQMTKGLSYEEFQKLEVTTLPHHGDEGFLMTSVSPSEVTLQEGDHTEGKDIGEVQLRRLAARFDVESKVEALHISRITLVGAKTKSFLQTQASVPSDCAEEITFEPKSEGWFTPTKATAGIYAYEDPTPGATKIRIEGKYRDLQWTKELTLSKEGKPIPVKRNHLYRITISRAKNADDDGRDPLDFKCTVVDWSSWETTVHDDDLGDYKAVQWIKYEPMYSKIDDKSFSISLKKTFLEYETGSSWSKNVTLSPAQVSIKVVEGDKEKVSIDPYKGVVTLLDQYPGKIVFEVKEKSSNIQVQATYARLEKEGKQEGEKGEKMKKQYLYTYNGAEPPALSFTTTEEKILSLMAETNVTKDGKWDEQQTIPTSAAAGTHLLSWQEAKALKVTDYHLPSAAELRSVFAERRMARFDLSEGTIPHRIIGRSEVYMEYEVCGANNSVTYNSATIGKKEITDGVKSQFAYAPGVTYGLRFIGTEYESAWKYEYVQEQGKQMLRITAVGLSGFTGTVKDVKRGAETLFKDQKATVRSLPAAGSSSGGQGTSGYFWSATTLGAKSSEYMAAGFGKSWIYGVDVTGESALSVRLFKDTTAEPTAEPTE